MRKLVIITLIIALSFALSSCRFGFKKPGFEGIYDVKLKSLSIEKSELIVSLIVHNPNAYNIKIKSLDVNLLSLKREKVGAAKLDEAIVLPKKAKVQLDFELQIESRKAISLLKNLDDNIDLIIQAVGEGKAMGITKKFRYEELYSISLKDKLLGEIPKFRVKGQDLFKVMRIYPEAKSFKASTLKIDFILLNPYGLTYTVKAFRAKIYIDNQELGQGNIKRQMKFNPDTFYREGTMEFELSHLKTMLGAAKGVIHGEIGYQVKGRVKIEVFGREIIAPYEYKGKIPVDLLPFFSSFLK